MNKVKSISFFVESSCCIPDREIVRVGISGMEFVVLLIEGNINKFSLVNTDLKINDY